MATKKSTTKKTATAKTSKKKSAVVTDDQLEKLQKLGYEGSDDEAEAKKFVLAFLAENDLEVPDENDLESLLDIASLFEPEATDSDDAETDDDEEEDDDEVEETDDDDEEEEEDDEEADDGDEEEEEEEDDEEEEEEDEEEDGDEDEDEFDNEEETPAPKKQPVAAKKAKKDKGSRGDFEPFDSASKKHLAVIKDILDCVSDKKKFSIAYLKHAITVRFLGENAPITLFAFCRLRVDVKNSLAVGAFNVTRMKSVEDFIEVLPKKYRDLNIAKFPGESAISIHGIDSKQVADILENSKFLKVSTEKALSTDSSLGKNRKKLEASLTKDKTKGKDKKKAKAPAEKEPVKKSSKKVAPAAEKKVKANKTAKSAPAAKGKKKKK